MKNIKKLAAMCSFAAMFAVSCVKENSVDIDNNASAPGFRTVVLNAGVDTKISSAGDILKWN